MPPFVLHGYNIINVPRASGIGGGVCIYVRDVFEYITTTFITTTNFEYAVSKEYFI